MNKAMRFFGLLFALLGMMVSVVAVSPVTAQAPIYSGTATPGDGVEGLALDRTTTIESRVWAIESVGDKMLVGGAFLAVRDRSNYQSIPKPFLAAFDPTTGEYVPWFRTQPDGPVYDIIDLGNNKALLLGEFSSVNGVNGTDGIAIIDVGTGLVDTSLSVNLGGPTTVIRSGAVNGQNLYVTGQFTSLRAGGVTTNARGLARINLSSRQADASFTPSLQSGGGWAVDTASNGRIFVGGFFASVNNASDTETLAALNPNGTLVSGWNHGFPHDDCSPTTFDTCGAVTGLAVTNNRVFTAGAKHFWVAQNVSNGAVLADFEISNDGQSVDIVDGMVIVGCHCSNGTGDDMFLGIEDRYIRVIDPVTLLEVESPTMNSEGSAGGWAAAGAPDGCLWSGGTFSSTTVGGNQIPAWSLLRFCKNSGVGTNPTLAAPVSNDTSAPTQPSAPTIRAQRASTIELSWTPSSDNSGQIIYYVYRNGALVGTTAGTTYVDPLLDPNAIYQWQVLATDLAGNFSAMSARSVPVEIGNRYNIATQATATQFNNANAFTTADKAIDGNTSGNMVDLSVSRTGIVDGVDRPWWNLDLGSVRNVDFVRVHPRRDNLYGETNNRLRLFYDTDAITGNSLAAAGDGGHRLWIGNQLGDNPVIEQADLATQVRYLRIFTSNNRVALAEVQVFTTNPLPTPATPAADTTAPTANSWKNVTNRGANTILRWGGATDNVAVAYYDVYQGGAFVGRTTNTSMEVGAAGQSSQAFEIVVVDAAGNTSTTPQTAVPVTACTWTVGGGNIEVDWTIDTNPTRFIVSRSVNGSNFFWRNSPAGADRSYTDSNRTGTLMYSVESVFGATRTTPTVCTENVGQDPVPQNLRSTFTDRRRVVLNWLGADPVEIERDGQIITTDNNNWHTDLGLTAGTTYTYRVRFVGSQTWSAPITATTTGNGGNVAPANCSVSINGNNITVSWASVNADVVIHRRVDNGSWWWRGKVSNGTTSFTDSNRSGTLTYRVKARYANGDSPYVLCN